MKKNNLLIALIAIVFVCLVGVVSYSLLNNDNKENNNKDNLEWVTGSENIKHSYQHGLRKPPCPNPKKVQIVETGEIFESASSCARSINGLKSHVCECIKGERATHKGYHFKEIL